jgi:hypothetical protein
VNDRYHRLHFTAYRFSSLPSNASLLTMPYASRRRKIKWRNSISNILVGLDADRRRRVSSDAELESLVAALSLNHTSAAVNLSPRQWYLRIFNPQNVARAAEACGLRFDRPPMRFQRWPKEEIAAAVDKLFDVFRDEVWVNREVLLIMVEKVIRAENFKVSERGVTEDA